MKPVIGINMCLRPAGDFLQEGLFLNSVYVRAVVKAGGLPVLIPVVDDGELLLEMAGRVDGLLMTGGDPEYRAATVEKPGSGGNIPDLPGLEAQNPPRHAFDLELCRVALENNIPVLGICRGHQTLNEAAGGTMVLNLDRVTAWQHRQKEPMDKPSHRVKFTGDSMLKKIFNAGDSELWVNSKHRQAVDKPAPGFFAASHSPDGIVEAVESKETDFAVGIQFHPEMMFTYNAYFLNVYRKLVDSARAYGKKRKASCCRE